MYLPGKHVGIDVLLIKCATIQILLQLGARVCAWKCGFLYVILNHTRWLFHTILDSSSLQGAITGFNSHTTIVTWPWNMNIQLYLNLKVGFHYQQYVGRKSHLPLGACRRGFRWQNPSYIYNMYTWYFKMWAPLRTLWLKNEMCNVTESFSFLLSFLLTFLFLFSWDETIIKIAVKPTNTLIFFMG